MNAWKGVAFLVGLAVCLSLAVVSTSSAAPAPLVIAVEGPQSGEQASNGLDQLRGVRLAVRRLDMHGGLWDGRKVVVSWTDVHVTVAPCGRSRLRSCSATPVVKAPLAVSSTIIATCLEPIRSTYRAAFGAIWEFMGWTVTPKPAVSSREVIQSGKTWLCR